MTTACGDLSWISGKGKEMNGGGGEEGQPSSCASETVCLQMHLETAQSREFRCESLGIHWVAAHPSPEAKRAYGRLCPPPAQMAATQARHPEGTCWELLSREPVTRVRDTFLEQRGNYLAHTSL